MTHNRYTTLLFSIVLLAISGSSFGQIYKWVDEAGKTHFSSSPPTRGEAEIVKPKINTYTSRKLPDPDNTKPGNKKSLRKSVVMYSAVWCGICKNAKRYFNQNGIAFKEYDIETSAKGRRDYKKLRGRGVPIILVGKKRINGFTPKSFKALYDG